jgi:hypothetical protein
VHTRVRKLLVSVSSLSVSVSLPFFTSFLLCSLLFLHFWSRAESGCCSYVRACVSTLTVDNERDGERRCVHLYRERERGKQRKRERVIYIQVYTCTERI